MCWERGVVLVFVCRECENLLDLLKHPFILPVYDVSVHEGYPYIVAEYTRNGSLKERIRGQSLGLLPVEEVWKILSQVGQAVHYAHERNIVHRDLKPANILFNANGDALLADFSIALKLDAARPQLTDASGTPTNQWLLLSFFNNVLTQGRLHSSMLWPDTSTVPWQKRTYGKPCGSFSLLWDCRMNL